MIDPPLKWVGGKRWLLPRLEALYAAHREKRVVEPFVGGMAVSLGLLPERTLLADVNPHLINFYACVSSSWSWDLEMRNDEVLYYEHRRTFNEGVKRGERGHRMAALFYFLNRTAFNGVCRFNQNGEFNVPFGKYKTINYWGASSPANEELRERLANPSWILASCDWRSIVSMIEVDDWIYLDPPYDTQFTTYSAGGFSWEDQVQLANTFADYPGPVIASNEATPRVIDLYTSLGYEVEMIPAPRRVSRTGNRNSALEILAMKNVKCEEKT